MAGEVVTTRDAGTGVAQPPAEQRELSDQDKPAAGDEVTPASPTPAAGPQPDSTGIADKTDAAVPQFPEESDPRRVGE